MSTENVIASAELTVNTDKVMAIFANTMQSCWRLIDTAPKDGTVVLLYRPGAYAWRRVAPGFWDSDTYAKKPRPYWGSYHRLHNITESRDWEPTMWQPIVGPYGD